MAMSTFTCQSYCLHLSLQACASMWVGVKGCASADHKLWHWVKDPRTFAVSQSPIQQVYRDCPSVPLSLALCLHHGPDFHFPSLFQTNFIPLSLKKRNLKDTINAMNYKCKIIPLKPLTRVLSSGLSRLCSIWLNRIHTLLTVTMISV